MISAASRSNGRSAGSESRRRARPQGQDEAASQAYRVSTAAAPPSPPLAGGAPHRALGASDAARRRRLWRVRAEPPAGGPGNPRRGRRPRPGPQRLARARRYEYRGRGPRDDRRRHDPGGAGGRARHADPRGPPEPRQGTARKAALGPLRRNRTPAAGDAAGPARRTAAARGLAAPRQARADRPRG